jgi:hypothetical protein
VEGVQHRGGVFELVADRVAVAAERVQRRRSDSGGDRLTVGAEPVGVDLPGPAGHQVQQPRPGLPLCLVRSTIPVCPSAPSLAGAGGADVLVDPGGVDPGQPVGVISQLGQQRAASSRVATARALTPCSTCPPCTCSKWPGTRRSADCRRAAAGGGDQPHGAGCPRCGLVAEPRGRRLRRLHDIPAFGAPVQLVWRQRRYRCREACPVRGFTEDHGLALRRPRHGHVGCTRSRTTPPGRSRRLSHRRGLSIGSLVATDPEGPRPTSPGPTRQPVLSQRYPPRSPKAVKRIDPSRSSRSLR